MGIHALTRFRASNIGVRSTWRSRTTGNLVSGSSVTGPSPSVSISAAHDCRGFPFTSMVHEPHTSSRHEASQWTGVVRSPCFVTGCLRISIRHEITFMLGCHGNENSSQRERLVGESCRLMRSSIVWRAIRVS